MLSKMYLANFLSFKERTEFDFTPSKYTILEKTNVNSNKILKGALLIGPNASGKSNALKGISYLIYLFSADQTPFNNYKCNFSGNPIVSTEYEFKIKKSIVNYLIEYNVQERKLSEDLKIDGITVIKRNANKGELRIDQHVTVDEQVANDTLFLRSAYFNTGRFPQSEILKSLVDYILNSFNVDEYNMSARLGKSINSFAEQNGVEKINEYLSEFNYNFFMEYGNASEGEGLTINLTTDTKAVFLKRKSYPYPSIIFNESQGNQVFADLLPKLISVIENPGMLVIDEFGNSLHNKLAEKIIRFFMERSTDSQLFVTSHHTNLISNSVFRPDQINLVTFMDKNGSQTSRLSQFGPREAQNLEKMYLGGMFEGLPIYEEIQN